MILVDSSVWVDHFRVGDDRLRTLLTEEQILIHPFIVGELALGSLTDRSILADLENLPQAVIASDAEVRQLIENARLPGTGVGWVDAHLLTSVRLTPGAALWTRDGRLASVATRMGLGAAA